MSYIPFDVSRLRSRQKSTSATTADEPSSQISNFTPCYGATDATVEHSSGEKRSKCSTVADPDFDFRDESVAVVATVADPPPHFEGEETNRNHILQINKLSVGVPTSHFFKSPPATLATPATVNLSAQDRADILAERLAIMQVDGGLPEPIALVLSKLTVMKPPAGFGPDRWQRVIDGACVFADMWGKLALDLGWTEMELWALHKVAPATRVDCKGLALSLEGAEVVGLDETKAIIVITPSGARQSYYRWHGNLGATLAWELPTQTDAEVPRDWATAKTKFDEMHQPRDMSGNDWQQARQDVDAFYRDGWPAEASKAGWNVSDFFGFGFDRRSAREPPLHTDRAGGLLWLLKGARVTNLTATTILLSSGIEYQRRAGEWIRRALH
jgi:hypothetical protein